MSSTTRPDMVIDWFRLLADLRKLGLTEQHIANETGIPRSTLLGWKQGSQPRHHEGERLIAMWRLHMVPPLPMRSLYDP